MFVNVNVFDDVLVWDINGNNGTISLSDYDESEINLFDNYYFNDGIFYTKDTDGNIDYLEIQINVLSLKDYLDNFSSFIPFVFKDLAFNLTFEYEDREEPVELLFPLSKYFDGTNSEIVINENNFYFRVSTDDLLLRFKFIDENGEAYIPRININDFYYLFNRFGKYFKNDADKLEELNTHLTNIFNDVEELKIVVNRISNFVDNSFGDYFSRMTSFISRKCSDTTSSIVENFDSKISNINIDLTPLEEKINAIDLVPIKEKIDRIESKFDLLKVFEISKVIDEKLSNLFSLKSLNGSNGSKFKDGESVSVKGYDGNWIVEGSYPMLNADNVTIIVYKLKQNDMVLLAPAPFVEKV